MVAVCPVIGRSCRNQRKAIGLSQLSAQKAASRLVLRISPERVSRTASTQSCKTCLSFNETVFGVETRRAPRRSTMKRLSVCEVADGRRRKALSRTREPLSVDDSMIVTLAAGPSAAVRSRDGQVMWRTTIPGDAFAVMPIQVGDFALTANAGGDVFSVRLATGAVWQIGTMDALAGAPGQVWAFVKLGGDTALVVTQLETDQGRGAIVAARIRI